MLCPGRATDFSIGAPDKSETGRAHSLGNPPEPAQANPLLSAICAQEGENYEPYNDGTGWHIGCGHYLNRDGAYAQALADRAKAEVEARRLLGNRIDRMVPARRDAIYLLCFSAACAGFGDFLLAVRNGAWNAAADEVLDSVFATDEKYPGRVLQAERIASWLRAGDYVD